MATALSGSFSETVTPETATSDKVKPRCIYKYSSASEALNAIISPRMIGINTPRSIDMY